MPDELNILFPMMVFGDFGLSPVFQFTYSAAFSLAYFASTSSCKPLERPYFPVNPVNQAANQNVGQAVEV